MPDFSVEELNRLDKVKKLKELSVNPYPSDEVIIDSKSTNILENFDEYNNKTVKIAGRLMSRRLMGKASFGELLDSYGRIQLYIKKDSIDNENEENYEIFKKLIDLGDFIYVSGYVFKTKLGEISIHVENLKLLSKAIKPLPCVKIDGEKVHFQFTNKEHIYRQRYLDLILNKESKEVFFKRTKITNTIRNYFNNYGYLEVETPVLQPLYGGASARPFTTHHNTLDQELYLRISNELYLKRLIIGGIDGVYEFSKDFRNEGMDRFHNPEFTQVELYVPYKDYKWMMNFTEDLLNRLAIEVCGSKTVQVDDNIINFEKPFKRFTMFEIIEHFTGIDISNMDEDKLRETAKKLDIYIDPCLGYGRIIDEIFGAKCEPNLIQPTFITTYPIEMSPLAKQNYDNPNFVDRFELFMNGKECANCFSELNDPVEQRKRFEEEMKLSKRGDDESMVLDEDFLTAMSYGMPPTAGIGIGIDRLTMILTNSRSIQDVILFPQMRKL